MARLIEVQDPHVCPRALRIQMGDTLMFSATGGHIRSAGDVVELIGPFVPAVVDDLGNVVAPSGAPNTILFRALQDGRAIIDVMFGDPFHRTLAVREFEISVES